MASVVPSPGSSRRGRDGQANANNGHHPQGKNLPWPLSATSWAMDNNESNDWILPRREWVNPQSEWVNPARSRELDTNSSSNIRLTDAIWMEHRKPTTVKQDHGPTRSMVQFLENDTMADHGVPEPISTQEEYGSSVAPNVRATPTITDAHFYDDETDSMLPVPDESMKPMVARNENKASPIQVPSPSSSGESMLPVPDESMNQVFVRNDKASPIQVPAPSSSGEHGNATIVDDEESSISSETIGTTDGVFSVLTGVFGNTSIAGSATQNSWVPIDDPEKKLKDEKERKDAIWPSEEFQSYEAAYEKLTNNSTADPPEGGGASLHQGDDQESLNDDDSWIPPDVKRSIKAKKIKQQMARQMPSARGTEGWVPMGEKHKSSQTVKQKSAHEAKSAYAKCARIDFTGEVMNDSTYFNWVPGAPERFDTAASSSDEQGSVTERIHSRSAPRASSNSSAKSNISGEEQVEVGGGAPQAPDHEPDDEDENDRCDDEHDPAAAGLTRLTAALQFATNGTSSSSEDESDQEQSSGLADSVEMEEQRPPPPPAPDGKSAPLSRTPMNSKTRRSSRLIKASVCIFLFLILAVVAVVVFLLIRDDGGNDNANPDVESPRQTLSPETLSPVITPIIVLPPTIQTAKPPDRAQTKPPVFAPPATQQPVFPPTRAPSIPTSPPTIFPMSPTSDALLQLLSSVAADGGAALRDPSSPQYRAMQSIRTQDNAGIYDDRRFLQRYALAALYYSTDGEAWSRKGSWLTPANECDWLSFSEADVPGCDSAGNVIYIDLAENNLRGPLPPDLALLARTLETLALPGNKITGGLPVAYSVLSNLSALKLSSNHMTGSIPSQYSTLTGLTTLHLSSNRFRNTMPAELSSLTKLRVLDLSKNMLTGRIPTQLELMVELSYLSLSHNLLTGPIPAQIGNLNKLNELYLDKTDLGPSLAATICALQLDELWSDCAEIGGCSCCTTCCVDGLTCFPNL